MKDEKNRYEPLASLPIPTYDEATSSRPSSSQSYLGPAEVSHDAERQGLLDQSGSQDRSNGYQPPTVESARSSVEFLPGNEVSRGSEEAVRREILEEMDIMDPATDNRQAQLGASFSKRISSLRLPSFHFPFRRWFSSLDHVRARIPRIPDALKPGWIMVIRFLALLFVLTLAYLVFFTRLFRYHNEEGQSYDPESVRLFVQGQINKTRIVENLEHLTKWDHVAGTKGSFALAEWIKGEMTVAGLDKATLEQFDVYLNYPKEGGRRVAIIDPPEKAWEAKIEEEAAYQGRQQYPVFHGHSRSGNVTGHLIYANYGSLEDFRKLGEIGIDLKGAIVLVRYFGSQGDRALKVKAAEQAGAVGCLIYSDPNEDGFVKGKAYPEGRFRPSDGVQRGSVSLMSWVVGDVLSPGFASLPGEKQRVAKDKNPGLNNIPSLPLAWRDAQPLLQALKGHGQKLREKDWRGGVPDVEWWTGDKSSPTVHLKNDQDEVERQPIWNVVGKIEGIEQKEKSIIVGNHYDAWCFGGADPGSGTAVLLEIVRVFGMLKEQGWRPRRSIEFMAWDGEEYNLIGSTEHVEARMNELRRDGIAYLNVDVAVTGADFRASASPILEKALLRVLKRCYDPNEPKSLYNIWQDKHRKIEGLGAGSDYVAFQDMAGVSSMDIGFSGPAFPYHSCYDNFDWMKRFGDPDFNYHAVLAQVWGLLILQLADEKLLPFDLEAYAKAVKGYVHDLEKRAVEKGKSSKASNSKVDVGPLHKAVDLFAEKAKSFHEWGQSWSRITDASGNFESEVMALQRMSHNIKMADFETDLLDIKGGLPGREQFKHILFAPQAWSGYEEAFFPGPRDAIDADDWKGAQKQVDKAARIIREASEKLLQ